MTLAMFLLIWMSLGWLGIAIMAFLEPLEVITVKTIVLIFGLQFIWPLTFLAIGLSVYEKYEDYEIWRRK